MRIGVKYGLLLAALVLIWTLVIHALGVYSTRIQYAQRVDQAAMILPLITLAAALLEMRRACGGRLAWGRGVMTGLEASVVAAPPTVTAFWIYHHLINPDWLMVIVRYEREKLAAAGMAPEAIADSIERLQQSGTDGAQLVNGIVGTLAMGLLLSVLITLVLKLTRRA